MHNYIGIMHGYDDYAIECMHAWNVFNLYYNYGWVQKQDINYTCTDSYTNHNIILLLDLHHNYTCKLMFGSMNELVVQQEGNGVQPGLAHGS